jgi:hypothetical protein
MDEREQDHVEDLDVPESESEDVKGGTGEHIKKFDSPGALHEGAEPHLNPGALNQGFTGGV